MKMTLYTFEEVLDKTIGPVGTPRRDDFEHRVEEEVQAYHVGEAIRKARLAGNLSQEELGVRMGVSKSQISRLERGHSISLPSLSRVFRALGCPVSLDLGAFGRVPL